MKEPDFKMEIKIKTLDNTIKVEEKLKFFRNLCITR